jgi:hypothetical protein
MLLTGPMWLTASSFRLRDLPRELRDIIYELALEPRAIFRHAYRKDRDPTYSWPTIDHHSGMKVARA